MSSQVAHCPQRLPVCPCPNSPGHSRAARLSSAVVELWSSPPAWHPICPTTTALPAGGQDTALPTCIACCTRSFSVEAPNMMAGSSPPLRHISYLPRAIPIESHTLKGAPLLNPHNIVHQAWHTAHPITRHESLSCHPFIEWGERHPAWSPNAIERAGSPINLYQGSVAGGEGPGRTKHEIYTRRQAARCRHYSFT